MTERRYDEKEPMKDQGEGIPATNAEWEVSYAGIVRYTISSVLRRSTAILRKGLRVRPRTLAHSTDRLKELVEFREHYLTAHENHEGHAHSTAAKTSTTSHDLEKTKSGFRQVAREVLPGFIKHVGFATIVFSSYETIYDDYYLEYQREVNKDEHSYLFQRKFLSLAGPFLCGGVSGTLGGMYYAGWDKISNLWHQRHSRSLPITHTHATPHTAKHVIGMHTLVQGTLFSSYEVMKWILLNSQVHKAVSVLCHDYLPSWISLDHGDLSTHSSSPSSSSSSSSSTSKFSAFRHHGYPTSFGADVLSIVVCGGVAGSVSETVQHWIKLADLLRSDSTQKQELYQILRESGGFWHRLSNYRHIFLPSGHSALNAAIPMSLAFLAYEYGKAVSGHEQHHQHH